MSFEGSVTEEEYFERISDLFSEIRSKIQFISVAEDAVNPSDYNIEKVKSAISRAKELHLNKADLCPKYFTTTVYILLNKIMEMLPQDEQ